MPFDESHVDGEVLALLALGESVGSTADLAHIEECERCSDELGALRGVVDTARSARPLVPPAPHVWDRIADELGLAGKATTGSTEVLPDVEPAPVADLSSRRATSRGPRQWRWIAAAAAAGVLVGATGVWWRTSQEAPASVVATATLKPLPGWDASGSAVVETMSDGTRVLVVDLAQHEAGDNGFREVWLLKPDVSGLVSVGTLDGSSGRFDLPPGLDLTQFSVVDVSEEQFDGNPAHSGDSIVRGALRA